MSGSDSAGAGTGGEAGASGGTDAGAAGASGGTAGSPTAVAAVAAVAVGRSAVAPRWQIPVQHFRTSNVAGRCLRPTASGGTPYVCNQQTNDIELAGPRVYEGEALDPPRFCAWSARHDLLLICSIKTR